MEKKTLRFKVWDDHGTIDKGKLTKGDFGDRMREVIKKLG